MPKEKQCETCVYWKVDRGIWCVNGWSGDGKSGWCQHEPRRIPKQHDEFCHNWSEKL